MPDRDRTTAPRRPRRPRQTAARRHRARSPSNPTRVSPADSPARQHDTKVRHHRCRHRTQAVGDHEAGRGAGERQQQALGHQLADDAPAARAECESDRHLALAAQRADEHEVRDVDADDQQHGGDGDKQQQNRPPDQRIGALVVRARPPSRRIARRRRPDPEMPDPRWLPDAACLASACFERARPASARATTV